MTANEMRYGLLMGIDSVYQHGAPGYNDLQCSFMLNKAQRRVFNRLKPMFDISETVKRTLSPVISRASLAEDQIDEIEDMTLIPHPNGVFYMLPGGLAELKEEYVYLSVEQDEGPPDTVGPVIVLPITYDYYAKNHDNRYKQPHLELVWRMDYGLADDRYRVEIITGGEDILDYRISYIRYPQDIVVNTENPELSVDCEILDRGFRDEVVSEAIKIAVAALSGEGYNVASAERASDG